MLRSCRLLPYLFFFLNPTRCSSALLSRGGSITSTLGSGQSFGSSREQSSFLTRNYQEGSLKIYPEPRNCMNHTDLKPNN
uniref:Secreted protein n=1 Tax=Arundo donax TaxID=35708 RepID=A0A0A9DBX7_ARUDO